MKRKDEMKKWRDAYFAFILCTCIISALKIVYCLSSVRHGYISKYMFTVIGYCLLKIEAFFLNNSLCLSVFHANDFDQEMDRLYWFGG